MLVAPLYARHKGDQGKTDEDSWSIPWILRFCYLIRALKYIFPLLLALITIIDFFVTWKYCSILPLFYSSVFTSQMKSVFLVCIMYAVIYFIIITCDLAPIITPGKDPKVKCLLLLMTCTMMYCVSPFLLYTVVAVAFSFMNWTNETPEYLHVKWIYHNIIHYLQNDINTISKKYFRIARDRPLRIYIIMFKSLIMWLNIQLFHFLITDYPRYKKEWHQMKEEMETEEQQKNLRKRQRFVSSAVDNNCCGGRVCNDDNVGDIEEDEVNEEEEAMSNSPTPISKSDGCCDFDFRRNSSDYDCISTRLNRYNTWCNEQYFKSLRSPLAIIHEIIRSYPETQIDYVNVYNLAQRHLYRHSNEIYEKAQSKKESIYVFAAIGLYLGIIVHTMLFWICYNFGYRQESNAILGYIYIVEHIALFCIYGCIIFNVLHCDRLLTIIQNTAWCDDRLKSVIHDNLLGSSIEDNDGKLMTKQLNLFYIHHTRVVQIIVQHYMMLHILNLVLQRSWLSEIVIEYLYGFHASDGDANINGLIKNIIHGTNYSDNPWTVDINDNELSVSHSDEENSDEKCNNNNNVNVHNLENLQIPTDSNIMGISNKIVRTPGIEDEDVGFNDIVIDDGRDLLNDFMEEKFVENRRKDNDGMCVCHENDHGFIRMWNELNLDVIRLQYDAFKKSKESIEEYKKMIRSQHMKITRSMQFYFDFIRSLHYENEAESISNNIQEE